MTKLLLIDIDPERADRLSKRLHLRGFDAQVADSYLYALTMLEWQRPAAILVRSEPIDGMTPAQFCATVKQDDALREIVLARAASTGARQTAAISRFDLELEDADPDTLSAALATAIRSHQPATANETTDGPNLDLGRNAENPHDGFLTMLRLLSMGLSSGRISMNGDRRLEPISVILDHGQVVHAVFGGLEGAPAFRRLLDALARGEEISYRFELVPRWKLSTFPRSIRLADRQRILETLHTDDHATQDISVPIRGADIRER